MKYLYSIFLFFVVPAVAIGSAYFAYPMMKYHFLRSVDTYQGVRLTDTKQEVEYKLGIPPEVEGAPTSDTWGYWQRVYTVNGDPKTDKNALSAGDSFEKYQYWNYPKLEQNTGSGLTIRFDKSGHVINITCISIKIVSNSCERVYGFGIGVTEDKVRNTLGKPSYYRYNNQTKTLLYKKLHLLLTFIRQKLYIIEITKTGDLGEI